MGLKREATKSQIQRKLNRLRDPDARHTVVVCMGKDCQNAGSSDLRKMAEGCAGKIKIRVKTVPCLGCCGIAPAVAEDDHLMGYVSATRMETELRRMA